MRIAIVANGSSLLKLKKGKEIDAHDLVIRMNLYYKLKDPEITGLRTDIWSCCFDGHGRYKDAITEIGDVKKIWCARPIYWEKGNSYWLLEDWARPMIVDEATDHDYATARALIGGGNPTTGFLTICIANKVYPNDAKDLYGYDFYEPKLWYYEDREFETEKHHNPKGEKVAVFQWHKEGKVNLINE